MEKQTDKIIEKIKKDKKMFIITIIGIVAAVVLAVSSFGQGNSKKNSDTVAETTTVFISSEDIEISIESRLSKLVSSVSGAGNVSVMVKISSSGEYVYAENKKNTDNENSSSDENEYVVFEDSDGDDKGLMISVRSPEITGIAVLCDGGNSAVVRSEITNLITNLFGIGSDRVYVGCKSK